MSHDRNHQQPAPTISLWVPPGADKRRSLYSSAYSPDGSVVAGTSNMTVSPHIHVRPPASAQGPIFDFFHDGAPPLLQPEYPVNVGYERSGGLSAHTRGGIPFPVPIMVASSSYSPQSESRKQKVLSHALTSPQSDDDDVASPVTVKDMTNSLVEHIYDKVLIELVFETHRTMNIMKHLGLKPSQQANLDEILPDAARLGQATVLCHVCTMPIATTRFAQHLERCIGGGRQSHRSARKRMVETNDRINAEAFVDCNSDEPEIFSDPQSADEDWNQQKKRKRVRRGKKNGKA